MGLFLCATVTLAAFFWLAARIPLGFAENSWAAVYLVVVAGGQAAMAAALLAVTRKPDLPRSAKSKALGGRMTGLAMGAALEGGFLIAFSVRYPMVGYEQCASIECGAFSHTTGIFWIGAALVAAGALVAYRVRRRGKGGPAEA